MRRGIDIVPFISACLRKSFALAPLMLATKNKKRQYPLMFSLRITAHVDRTYYSVFRALFMVPQSRS